MIEGPPKTIMKDEQVIKYYLEVVSKFNFYLLLQ